MTRISKIAEEISVLMPVIARRVLSEFFAAVDLTQTQIFTIMTIDDNARCRLSDLSQQLNISAPTVTGIVDRLEKNQYLNRQADPDDRRAIQVVLTDKGKRVAKQLRSTLKKKWEVVLSKLSDNDSENYVKILRKIRKNLP